MGLPWLRGLAVSSTTNSFASTIPTVTEPVADGVHKIPDGHNTLELLLFGAGNDNTAFDARIVGWDQTGEGPPLWLPASIVEVTATRSAVVGVAGSSAINTDRFADTITINKGTGYAETATSDAEGVRLIVDITNFDRWQFLGNLSAGTNMNCLFRTSRSS